LFKTILEYAGLVLASISLGRRSRVEAGAGTIASA
jgi:hypothetical protein